MNKFYLIIIILLLTLVGIINFITNEWSVADKGKKLLDTNEQESLSISNSDQPFEYQLPKLQKKDSYTIIIVGDSMTDALGPNLDQLRLSLMNNYPNTTFGLFNYGYSSTNITSLMDRLTTETEYKGEKKEPILSREFDILIIESFGHNPLSQEELTNGLKKQDELLTAAVERVMNGHPGAVIVFLSTIGANENNYGAGLFDLNQDQRKQWADERNSYIENHIKFAEKHNIPLINIYEETFNDEGVVEPKYINKDSWIHPSDPGIIYISEGIADHIYEDEIIPH